MCLLILLQRIVLAFDVDGRHLHLQLWPRYSTHRAPTFRNCPFSIRLKNPCACMQVADWQWLCLLVKGFVTRCLILSWFKSPPSQFHFRPFISHVIVSFKLSLPLDRLCLHLCRSSLLPYFQQQFLNSNLRISILFSVPTLSLCTTGSSFHLHVPSRYSFRLHSDHLIHPTFGSNSSLTSLLSASPAAGANHPSAFAAFHP